MTGDGLGALIRPPSEPDRLADVVREAIRLAGGNLSEIGRRLDVTRARAVGLVRRYGLEGEVDAARAARRDATRTAIEEAGGDLEQAAEALGLTPATLRARAVKWGILPRRAGPVGGLRADSEAGLARLRRDLAEIHPAARVRVLLASAAERDLLLVELAREAADAVEAEDPELGRALRLRLEAAGGER